MLYNRLGRSLLTPLLAFLFLGWTGKDKSLFKQRSPLETGVTFNNIISENDQLNILNEAYIYNGGGVGIGDFNNDGLPDIYFAGNMVSNKLYLNKGNLKFADITLPAGVTGEGRWSTGVSVVDINADGKLDIYVCASFSKDPKKRVNLLYINQGNNRLGIPVFKELAKRYGIADDGYSTQGVFFDYDRDGDLDLYLVTNTLDDKKTPIQFRPKVTDGSALNTDRLYRNNGNETFTNVSKESGILIEGWGHAVSISDINKDGYPDIYVSNDFVSNDVFYINNKDGTFTDRISDYFKHTSWFTMGTDIVDINNDGRPDLFALDMLPENNLRKKGMLVGNEYYNYFNNKRFNYQHQYVRNVLQINSGMTPLGHPVFSDVGFMAGVYETDWSWAPLVADYDNDGYRDIVITNGLPRDVTDLDYVSFDNGQGGSKVNTSLKMVDALPVVKVANYAFRNTGGYMFENATATWGLTTPSFSNGGAYADLDNDGDLDLVINNINEASFIFENTINSKGQQPGQHFLEAVLLGAGKNTRAVGATINVYYAGNKQLYYEQQPCRGYLSTVDSKAHFGLGATTVIDSLRINWPDGKTQLLVNLAADQVLQLSSTDATVPNPALRQKIESLLFANANASTGIVFKHQEKDAVDYNIQPTLPHKLSQYGPGIAVGDIDGNGYDDFYIGGSAGNKGTFFLQDQEEYFKIDTNRITYESNIPTEEMGVLLFDADNDGDQDLYAVAGSYELSPKHPGNQDKLYLNNGKGLFKEDYSAVPEETANGSCVRAADFDKDGDLDLFVGGRSVSGAYPISSQSFLLRNEGGKFVDVTQQYCPELSKAGMISDALWSDFDQDGNIDLVLAGEWMPVTFFRNTGTAFKNITTLTGIDQHVGWWNSLTAGDFDNDGDMDYVAGNLGLNSPFKGTMARPMYLYAKDLDNNGKSDPIIFCYLKAEDGTQKPFPMHTRDDMVSAVNAVRKRYPTYKSFGRAGLTELLSASDRESATAMIATDMNTSYIENKGNGKFSITPLPLSAQVAPVYGMISQDINNDGNLDLVLVGNDYGMEPGGGRHDAFIGLCLKGKSDGTFEALPLSETGVFVNGDAKGLSSIRLANGGNLLVATQNQDSIKAFSGAAKSTNANRWIKLQKDDWFADIEYKGNKKRKVEFYYGSTFLSQSSRGLAVDDEVVGVIITDFRGNKRKVKP
jgi:hypothetical protein